LPDLENLLFLNLSAGSEKKLWWDVLASKTCMTFGCDFRQGGHAWLPGSFKILSKNHDKSKKPYRMNSFSSLMLSIPA
jgi:hypothetical protein